MKQIMFKNTVIFFNQCFMCQIVSNNTNIKLYSTVNFIKTHCQSSFIIIINPTSRTKVYTAKCEFLIISQNLKKKNLKKQIIYYLQKYYNILSKLSRSNF